MSRVMIKELWWKGDDLHVVTEDGGKKIYKGPHVVRATFGTEDLKGIVQVPIEFVPSKEKCKDRGLDLA